MNIKDALDIIACLPQQRTLFNYHNDLFCAVLLGAVVGDGVTVRDLKQTNFGRLLHRPIMRDALSRARKNQLTPDLLPWATDQDKQQLFSLTLATWGKEGGSEWDQTSRNRANLVLQLNFPGDHDVEYLRRVQPSDNEVFAYDGHPINSKGRNTLAWARIDVDLDTGEALIEEIQTDWIREAFEAHDDIQDFLDKGNVTRAQDYVGDWISDTATPESVLSYVNEVLAPYATNWAEAMMTAALWFIRYELGITQVYYHTWEGGSALKSIEGTPPPRSLYTDLPRRFCFNKTRVPPKLMMEDRRLRRKIHRLKNPEWHSLQLAPNNKAA